MDFFQEALTKPLSTFSAYSYVPPRRNEPKEMSYFNKDSKVSDVSTYDHVFHQAEGFDTRLPRDDRKHWRGRGLDINQEERSRVVPVLSSSEYGHRSSAALYQTHREHAHVARIKADFYMKNGILWSLAEGYGSVVPI
ncbi:cilia- and flagella-associated protein 90 [Xenentodon cancila]